MPVPISEIKQALEDLGLERPMVQLVRLPGNRLRLAITAICYPERGEIVITLPEPTDLGPITTLPQPVPAVVGKVQTHELTNVPAIGAASAQVLQKAGIHTPTDLAATSNARLQEIGIRPHTFPKIRRWLADEGYSEE